MSLRERITEVVNLAGSLDCIHQDESYSCPKPYGEWSICDICATDYIFAHFRKAVEGIENRYKAKAHDEPIVAEKLALHPAFALELVWGEAIQAMLELVKEEK